MAGRAPATPQEIDAHIEEVRMRGTISRGSPSREEEPEDLVKAIIPFVSIQDTDSSSKIVEEGTSSQDVPTGVKNIDDLLRWARVEDDVEEEASSAQAEEAIGERNTDAPTSTEEEVAAILSEIFGDIHQHTGAPVDTDPVTAQVTTSPATSDSSHSSDEILLKDRVSKIIREKKAVLGKKGTIWKEGNVRNKSSVRKEVPEEGESSKKKFKTVAERGLIVERVIDEVAFKKYVLTELLQERSPYKSVTFAESYSLPLVQEFYSSLLPSDKGITKVYIWGKWIPFTSTCLNRFLEFKSEVKENYEKGLELNEDVLKEIIGGRTESWGEETRLPTSTLIAKYNVLIVKELAILLYAIGTEKKFNLGRKRKAVTVVKKLKISQKLFTLDKKIDLPIGRMSPPSMSEDAEEKSVWVQKQLCQIMPKGEIVSATALLLT
ncbi:uncharacterized protein LOC120254660 [Dioscorea cayenensis subsp. rotundata]|uniref:Uncharacterized protein LOC120254660 n=1 Tax=Dioscorea cayennensis subsp. rotundata TaxID=55577 RepID=A0AB40AUK1_DIOCR|nr:uncharacterized protein LOC120254660 [Dioscorea cayenensis subsp. rotundata]